MIQRIHAGLSIVVMLAALAVGLPLGMRYFQARAESRIYQQRLTDLAQDHSDLVQQYNQAITRTAVTELRVKDGRLDVVVMSAAGELKRIATPYDPTGEIYVDYVVRDGRLWIRRVFDSDTAPKDATVIDPQLVDLDWDADGLNHGKAVYRSLAEGRWVVTVTGDGSLGLRQARPADELQLMPAPLGEFTPAQDSSPDATRPVKAFDYFKALPGR